MSPNFKPMDSYIKANRLKTAFFIALFAFFSTFAIEYIFSHAINRNLILGIGTSLCAFIITYILHYLLFDKLHSNHIKYTCLILFPAIYIVFLISSFGLVTTLISLSLFQVPFINQIYLQMWAFLGNAFIYAAFSPKIPFLLTCILVMGSFFYTLKNSNSQQDQQQD